MSMNELESRALDRLIAVAQGDTDQSRRVANFLLAWWNAQSLGGFDPTDLFVLDHAISADIATVVVSMARNPETFYPTDKRADIEALIAFWRPQVWQQSMS